MINKRALAPLIIVFIFLAGLVTLGSLNILDTASITGSSDQVWKAREGRLECLEDQAPATITKYADQNYEFTCGDDYLVDECVVYASCDIGLLSAGCTGNYLKNDQKVSYVIPKKTTNNLITTLYSGEKIKFYSSSLNLNEDYTKITYSFSPYRLYTIEGGKYLSNSADCCLANQDELEKNQFKYGEWECLEKSGADQWKNYIIDWTATEGEVYEYNGEDVICASNILYNLKRTKLADGTTRNIQGEKIKNVECCPYQSNKCDSKTFKFLKVEDKEERGCMFSYQCENSGNPFSTTRTTAKQESCISGTCVEKTLAIECNSDAQCRSLRGEGYGCDLTYDNFGKCIKVGQIDQPRCGDLYCQTGETKDNCPSDCELVCPEGYQQITTEKQVDCLVGWPLYWSCDTETTKECKLPSTNWVLWAFIILAVFVVLYFGLPFIKMGLNRIGVRI